MKMLNGKASTYTYQSKRNGNNVIVHQLLTMLVDEKPSHYCIGFAKGTERDIQHTQASTKVIPFGPCRR